MTIDTHFETIGLEHIALRQQSDLYDSVAGQPKKIKALKGKRYRMYMYEAARRQRERNEKFCRECPEKCRDT